MTEYVIANLSERYGPFWVGKSGGSYLWSLEFSQAAHYASMREVDTAIIELQKLGVDRAALSVVSLPHAAKLAAGADNQKPLQIIEARIEEIRSEYINKLNIFDGLKAEWRRAVHQLEYIARKLKEA